MKSALVQTSTRRMRVRVGDVLRGAEGDVVTTIEIMYIGRACYGDDERLIIARTIANTRDGKRASFDRGESDWTLSCRDWRRVRRS